MDSVNIARKPLGPSNLPSCRADIVPSAKTENTSEIEDKENALAAFGKARDPSYWFLLLSRLPEPMFQH
jgi:hypothetical protein